MAEPTQPWGARTRDVPFQYWILDIGTILTQIAGSVIMTRGPIWRMIYSIQLRLYYACVTTVLVDLNILLEELT